MTRRRVLTGQQIREIRAIHSSRRNGGKGYASLARRYGVGPSTIRDVVKYWVRPLV